MALIERIHDFTAGTPIVSAEVDAEFDQLVGALNPAEGAGIEADNLSAAVLALITQGAGEPGDYCWSARGTKDGWVLCDGQAISRVDFAALFAVIGTVYGVGDGATTFNVPEARGRSLYHTNAANPFIAALGDVDGYATVAERGPGHIHGLANHLHSLGAHTHATPNHTHVVLTAASGTSSLASSNLGGDIAVSLSSHFHSGATANSGAGTTSTPSPDATSIPAPNDSDASAAAFLTANLFIKT